MLGLPAPHHRTHGPAEVRYVPIVVGRDFARPSIRTFVLALWLFGLGATAMAGGELSRAETSQLRAGAATSNVTPWLGLSLNGSMRDRAAKGIHDELHARALVLESGSARLAFVIVDSCMLPRSVVDGAKMRANEIVGIPPSHLLIAATHSHSCPTATGVFQSEPSADYQRYLAAKIADAVVRAVNHLQPARVGWGAGSVPQHVFNRRWRMKPTVVHTDPFGGTHDQVRMNPPVGSPDLVEPAGPTDPALWVLSVRSLEGDRPIALLANYSLHYVGGTRAGDVSADYFGMFAERVSELLAARGVQPPFVAMLSNGASGDINNINFRAARPRREPYEQMRRVAHDVAAEALRVAREIVHRPSLALDVETRNLTLGVRRPSEVDVKRAREILAAAGDRELRGLSEVYARETILLAEYPENVELVLQTLRIGDLAVCAIPCEVFVEIGLELRAISPFESTFTISLANGYNGYLPTAQQHQLGGYETWRARSSYLQTEAAARIVAELRSQLEQLRRGRGASSGSAASR